MCLTKMEYTELPSYGINDKIFNNWPCWDLERSTKSSSEAKHFKKTIEFTAICTTPEVIHIESFTLTNIDMPPDVDVRNNQNKLIENPTQPSKELTTVMRDIRPRLMSESENFVSDSDAESDDCGFIVFEEGSESECSHCEFESASSEEDEEEDNTSAGHKVRFNSRPKIHVMVQWNFAYRAARIGPWEQMARDRERFRGRINTLSQILSPILNTQHRECIYQTRFV